MRSRTRCGLGSAMVLMAAFTGLRWGELLALRRRHVVLDGGALVRVRTSLAEVDGKLVEGPPKSAAGRRDVAIPAAIVPDLQVHLDEWSEDGAEGRVFVGPLGATPRRGNFQAKWRQAIDKAGVPGLHFHDLRHTGNTLAAEGASLRGAHGEDGAQQRPGGADLPARQPGPRAGDWCSDIRPDRGIPARRERARKGHGHRNEVEAGSVAEK